MKQLPKKHIMTVQNYETVAAGLEQLRSVIGESAINLSPEARRKSRNIAESRLAYAEALLTGAKFYEKHLPRDLNFSDGLEAFLAFKKLQQLKVLADEVAEMIDDTLIYTSENFMSFADQIYASLQLAKTRSASIDKFMDRIAKHNKKFSNKSKDNADIKKTIEIQSNEIQVPKLEAPPDGIEDSDE